MKSWKFDWQEITCLEEKISFRLPHGWKRAEKETTARKFPYTIKPQEVFTDAEENEILTWNLLDKPLQETQVYPAIREIQRLINHMYPESSRKPTSCIQVQAGIAGYFVFVTGGIKHDTAHCMFVLSAEGKMLLGSYHFPVEGMQENMTFLRKILENMQVLEDEEDERAIGGKRKI